MTGVQTCALPISHREPGGGCFAEEEDHRVHPWCSEDREPQETRLRLRVLRGYPTVRWRAWLEISPEVKTRPVLNCRLENVVVDEPPFTSTSVQSK